MKGMFSMSAKRIVALSLLAAVIFSTGCSKVNTGPDNPESGPKLFIAESDFLSGLLEWKGLSDNALSGSHLSIFNDAALKSFGGYLYVIEHFGADNVMKFDPSKSGPSGVVYQTHIGNNWNPQEIAFLSATKAYISNMNEPKISIFDPSSGAVSSAINIAAYTFKPDSNTSPYAGAMQMVGSDLYVLLQRRNGYNPGAPSLILKINTATDAVVDTIATKFKNGYAMAYTDGALYVSNPGGSFTIGDGAIEKVDLATKTVSTVITETALGGKPNLIAHKSGSHFYVQNYIGWKNEKVVELDAATGTVVATLPGVKDAYGGIFYDSTDAKLYVGERDSVEMGVRIFENNVQTGATLTSASSLPPTGLVVIR
jgi:DNA-binding beta-propeller fold protein YncE